MKLSFLFTNIAFIYISLTSLVNADNSAKQNIVLILMDDISHYGVTAYGADRLTSLRGRFNHVEFSTPNIDKLAKQGFMAANAHAYPLCENTRVAIMSGKDNQRNYLRPKSLHASDITFGDTFKKAGYKTGLFGKWKQTRGTKTISGKNYINEFGWDEYTAFDVITEGQRFINPNLVINGKVVNYEGRTDTDPLTGRRWYGPDIVNRDALKFIEKNQDHPFFLYYPMMLIHDEHQPTPDTMPHSVFDNFVEKKIKGVANTGDDHLYLPDMIKYMDKLIGKVVQKLDELNLRENTLIVIVGDNGTKEVFSHIFPDNQAYLGRKGGHADNGTHVPLILNQPKTIPASHAINLYQGMIDITDIYPTIAEAATVNIPNKKDLDGISFWPQALGKTTPARNAIYHWGNGNNQYQNHDLLVEYAFDQNFKRYAPNKDFPQGRFFDLRTDKFERDGDSYKEYKFKVRRYTGLDINSLTKEQKAGYEKLGNVLEQNKLVEIKSIAINPVNTQLNVGHSVQLTANITPLNTTRNGVIWHSSDPSILSINKFGEAVAKAPGTATITLYSWADAQPLANNKNPEYLRTGVQSSKQFTIK